MSNYLYSDPLRREGIARVYRLVKVANPAAGVEPEIAVPGGSIWYLEAVRSRLTADATVANRIVSLEITDGTDVLIRIPGAGNITAGQTGDTQWLRGFGNQNSASGSLGHVLPAPDFPLFPGYRVRLETSSLQAGDQFNLLTLYVCEIELRGLTSQLARDVMESVRENQILDTFEREGI